MHIIALLLTACAYLCGADYTWAQAQAEIKPKGDLEWAPRAFAFQAGKVLRYIDFEGGDDAGDGSRKAPWKHHPWDARSRAKAAAHTGPTTYVFKRGVTYRGALTVKESGTAEEPNRLTSDPSWGQGEARFYGSRQVTGWQQGAHAKTPNGATVWHADIDFTPRHAWLVGGDGTITPLLLARTPNWDLQADPRSPVAQWFEWENPKWWDAKASTTTVKGTTMHLCFDTKNLTEDADYYEGAYVWTQWGTMMGGPYPTRVMQFDAKRKALAFEGPWEQASYQVRKGNRYYLEDKPHYLDQDGEFWFEHQGKGGRLYVRLPGGANPNQAKIEAADVINFIDGKQKNHLHVSGLVFRFGNVHWKLEDRFFRHADVNGGVVRMREGPARGIRVSNCVFEYVSNAVQLGYRDNAGGFEDIEIADSLIQYTDHHAVDLSSSGTSHDIRIMRNRMHECGRRAIRPNGHFTVNLGQLHTGEIAGNIITRAYAAGINVTGGGRGGHIPLVRILIHHNKVVDSLLAANDWGGIETWQAGPVYTYNNVSGNPVGPFHGKTFGFAYYLDGAFKNYLFNNIAWGRINDPTGQLPNFSAFQEIHSYQNTFFNNTAYRFMHGSRRQAGQAGRNKYLGNVFQDISVEVFRHTDSNNEDPNAQDAGQQKTDFAYYTNAYARNVFHSLGKWVGSFHAQGGKYADLQSFAATLAKVKPLAASTGTMVEQAPLRDAANGDFRLNRGSPAIDNGVRVFVPWALYGTVAEWNFTPRQDEPNVIIDEHFMLTSYHIGREDYYTRPLYPLQGQGIAAKDFVAGPLEDWTTGALRLDGQRQHLVATHAAISKPFIYTTTDQKTKKTQEHTVSGVELQNPDIHDGDLLIEVYLQVGAGESGVLVQKRDAQAGYELVVLAGGVLELRLLQGGTVVASRRSTSGIADGAWHHVMAEVARGEADGLRIYLDGVDASGAGQRAAPGGSLANGGDLLVGGGPGLDHLACTIDFLRICRGTLAKSRTDIAELHAWQFTGPHLRDFTGRKPAGSCRDAGAVEFED